MKILKNRIFRLLVVLGGMTLIVILSQSIYSLWHKQDIIREREEALTRVEAENQRLKQALKETQDPAFVERQAREKLGMVKEGETIVLMDKSRIPNPNDTKNQEQIPNWRKWWSLFF